MIACTGNPTLSWRGPDETDHPCRDRGAERKVLRSGDDQAGHDGQTCHTFIGETFEETATDASPDFSRLMLRTNTYELCPRATPGSTSLLGLAASGDGGVLSGPNRPGHGVSVLISSRRTGLDR